jgi:signal transduction histidine kinase
MANEYLVKVTDELVQNAFKFSEEGKPVRVTLKEAFNGALLTISDEGRGFSTEQIAQIGAYMQFERKMNEQQGLGLGLTIAKRLVELHGGTFSIEGKKGEGATIIAKLPRRRSRPIKLKRKALVENPQPAPGKFRDKENQGDSHDRSKIHFPQAQRDFF